MEATDYLNVGQRWIRADGQDQIRLVGTRNYRWVVEHDTGDHSELTAAELRAGYRLSTEN